MDFEQQEREKYQKSWDHKDYRNYAPGEHLAVPFILQAKPPRGTVITDWGTGTGRGALFLHECGYQLQLIDIAENCLDDDVRGVLGDKLQLATLWDATPEHAPTGYCTDVMEHIPPEMVEATIANIMQHCDKVYFNICFHEDHFGKEIGDHLHLTVKPFKWWRDLLRQYGDLTDARDMIFNGSFILEARHD